MKFSLTLAALASLACAAPTPEAAPEAVPEALSEEAYAAAAGFRLAPREWLNGEIVSRQSVPATNCTKTGVHFLAVRGHGGKVTINGTKVDDPNRYNVLSSTRNLLLAQIPGSDAVALPYDYNNPDEISGTNTGSPMFKSYIQNYVASCPNSKIATLGYSQGALVVMDGLCGASEFPVFPSFPISSRYSRNVIAAALYGDESRVPMQSWNAGTCPTTTGTGMFPRLNNFACQPYAAAIRSYCDQEDNFCCVGGNNTAKAHAAYVKVYNQPFVDFVKARMAATGSK